MHEIIMMMMSDLLMNDVNNKMLSLTIDAGFEGSNHSEKNYITH